MDRLFSVLLTLGRGRAWAITAAGWLFLVAADYLTGPKFAFGALYAIVVSFAAATIGLLPAILIGVSTVGISIAINGIGGLYMPIAAGAGIAAISWNISMRLIGLGTVVILVAGLRRAYLAARVQADRDPLTGLLNRRGLELGFLSLLSRARRSGGKLLVAFVDIDNFKVLNDGAGHQSGDEILQIFAASASSATRAGDLVARVGGDEFALVVAVDDVVAGRAAARRIHRDLKHALVDNSGFLSCSMGAIIHDPKDHLELDVLLHAADALLLTAKKSGKGSVRFGRPVDERRRGSAEPVGAVRAVGQ